MIISDKHLFALDDLFGAVNYYIYDYWIEIQDPRTKHLPFINFTPLWMITFVLIYYTLVKVIIPRYMENRGPYSLRKTMLIYNAYMAITNLWAFIEVAQTLDYGRIF